MTLNLTVTGRLLYRQIHLNEYSISLFSEFWLGKFFHHFVFHNHFFFPHDGNKLMYIPFYAFHCFTLLYQCNDLQHTSKNMKEWFNIL